MLFHLDSSGEHSTLLAAALFREPVVDEERAVTLYCRGILIKGGRVLDALAACHTVALDKTGTLTTGALACTSMRRLSPTGGADGGNGSGREPAAEASQRTALAAAVALSLRSTHPVAEAVVLHGQAAAHAGAGGGGDGALQLQLLLPDVSDFRLVPGGGVQGLLATAAAASESSRSSSKSSSSSSCSTSSNLDSDNLGLNGSSSSSRWHRTASFGSLDFVGGMLSPEEVVAVRDAAVGQDAAGVVSVLVLDAAIAADEEAVGEAGAGAARREDGGDYDGDSGGSGDQHSARSVWVLCFEDSVRRQSAAAVHSLQTVSRGCADGCYPCYWINCRLSAAA